MALVGSEAEGAGVSRIAESFGSLLALTALNGAAALLFLMSPDVEGESDMFLDGGLGCCATNNTPLPLAF